MIQPFLWQAVGAQARQLRTQLDQSTAERSLKTELAQADRIVAEREPTRTVLADIVPPSDTTPRIIQELEDMAVASGLASDVQLIEPEPDPEHRIDRLLITIKLDGDPAALFGYVDKVEHLKELTSVERLTLFPASGPAVGPTAPTAGLPYSLVLRIVFYLQSPSDGTAS